MMGLDLPPPPLFQDVMEKNIIPQARIPDAGAFLFARASTWLCPRVCFCVKLVRMVAAAADLVNLLVSCATQVPLAQIMTKFDGQSVHDTLRQARRRPPYLAWPALPVPGSEAWQHRAKILIRHPHGLVVRIVAGEEEV